MNEQLSFFSVIPPADWTPPPTSQMAANHARAMREINNAAPAPAPVTGHDLGEIGMAQTLEAEREDWILRALAALRRFSALPGWEEFKTEDFRWWCSSAGVQPPHHFNVWGALTNRAANEGIIRFTGKFRPSVSPRTHGHNVKVWTRA